MKSCLKVTTENDMTFLFEKKEEKLKVVIKSNIPLFENQIVIEDIIESSLSIERGERLHFSYKSGLIEIVEYTTSTKIIAIENI